jgi:hypothetical protein
MNSFGHSLETKIIWIYIPTVVKNKFFYTVFEPLEISLVSFNGYPRFNINIFFNFFNNFWKIPILDWHGWSFYVHVWLHIFNSIILCIFVQLQTSTNDPYSIFYKMTIQRKWQHRGYTRWRKTKTKTQHNMCWTPPYVNKHKQRK